MNDESKQNPLEARVIELETNLEQMQAELADAKEGKVRALADLDNFRRRQAGEQLNWSNRAVTGFLQKIVPNMLELSLGAAHSADETAKQTIAKFFDDMNKHGFESIEPEAGEAVDANLHEVLMAEEGEPGKVVRCLEIGWKFQDNVITPAKISAATL